MTNYLSGDGYNATPKQEIEVKNEIVTLREELDMIPLDWNNDSDIHPEWDELKTKRND